MDEGRGWWRSKEQTSHRRCDAQSQSKRHDKPRSISFTSVSMMTVWRDALPPVGRRLTLQLTRKPQQLDLQKTIGTRILSRVGPEPSRAAGRKCHRAFNFPGQNEIKTICQTWMNHIRNQNPCKWRDFNVPFHDEPKGFNSDRNAAF